MSTAAGSDPLSPGVIPAPGPLTVAAFARLKAVEAGLADGPAPDALGVAVVIADFEPAAFIAGAAAFATEIPDEARDGWYRTFTRTVFLAGRPAHVADRHAYLSYGTADTDLVWYGPAPPEKLRPLSLLLRAFQGPAPVEVADGPLTVTVPGPPTGRTARVAVATRGVSVNAYLVHVHHLIAEAVLRGLVGPGDALRVTHHPDLNADEFADALDPARADTALTRIAPADTASADLRMYGVLVAEPLVARCPHVTRTAPNDRT